VAACPAASAFAQGAAKAAGWKPDRPIEFVVQAGAGGGSDLFARTMAQILTKEKIVDVPVNVVNKPGGSGAVAYSYVNGKKGDPHVIATATSSYLTTPIQGHSPVSYRDFVNVAILCVEDYVGVVRNESPHKSLKDLIAAAKAKPNAVRVGGSSVGSSDHIIAMMMNKAAGIKLNFIVFQSGGEANAALLGGSIDFAGPNPSEAAQLIAAKRLRPIAMFSPERLPKWKDVPTAREQGVDVTFEQHRGLILPSGLSKEQVQFWQGAITRMFESPAFKKYMDDNGLRPLLKVGDEAEKYIGERSKFYAEIMTELGLAKQPKR
jgi:putative tricarboxylic transport membrane protein